MAWRGDFDEDLPPLRLHQKRSKESSPEKEADDLQIIGSDEDLDECVAAWHELGGSRRMPQLGYSRPDSRSRSAASGRFSGHFNAAPSYQLSAQAGPLICIYVGDSLYRATASTLRRAPFLEHLLERASELQASAPLSADGAASPSGVAGTDSNPLFVDRSGESFAYILDFLRSGHWLLGDRANDPEFTNALRDEAAFYGLDPLNHFMMPMPRLAEYVTIWQFRDDTSWYVDCLEQTIRDDPDHQGLFRLCKYSGGLPLDDQTRTKRFKATTHSAQSVIAYFAMRGFALNHVIEGSTITHTTSADGQSRNGQGVQYILSRLTTIQYEVDAPNTQRGYEREYQIGSSFPILIPG